MIGLSPAMQWWFIPHITIVFVYAMTLFDIGYYFFVSQENWKRWLMTLLAIIFVVGFGLSFFPSMQVICAYSVITLLIAVLNRDRDRIKVSHTLWIRLLVAVFSVGGIMGYFLFTSWDAIQLVMNTVYPGQRVAIGGDSGLYELFTNLTSIYIPFLPSDSAYPELIATFVQFAPFFLLLFPRLSRIMRKNEDRNEIVGRMLVGILLVLIIFMCIGFSTKLAEITLFKYVNRMYIPYGWIAALFTIWSIDAIWKNRESFKTWEKILYPLIFAGVYCTFIDDSILQYLSINYYLIEILVFMLILIFAMFEKKRLCAMLLIIVMIFGGATYNPVRRGISPVTNHPISDFIQETIQEDADAKWITIDTSFVTGQFLLANGAHVIDATNFYPDYDKWKLIDSDGIYDDSYNRYSNQTATLTEEDSWVELNEPLPDLITIHLNPSDLYTLGVTYIVTATDIVPILNRYNIDCEVVFQQDSYSVYKLGN